MKQHIRALAVTALFTLGTTAHAQSSVSLGGIMDIYGESISSGRNKATRLQSGGLNGSGMFFRGTEDLGGGMSAHFVLESGILLDSGNYAQGGRPFGRQAFVGLRGAWGTVNLGRVYVPLFYVARDSDVYLLGSYSPGILPGDPGNLNIGGTMTGAVSARADNAISWQSPNLGGFTLSALYSLGSECAGVVSAPTCPTTSKQTNRNTGASVQYAKDKLRAGLAWNKIDEPTATANKDTDVVLGTSYDFGLARLTAQYNWMARDLHAGRGDRARTWVLGAKVPVTQNAALLASYARKDVRNSTNDAVHWTVGYQYYFSKRTTLYTNYSRLTNRNGANFMLGTSNFANSAAGDDPRALQVGMQHRF